MGKNGDELFGLLNAGLVELCRVKVAVEVVVQSRALEPGPGES
jgi:hypothetical protein